MGSSNVIDFFSALNPLDIGVIILIVVFAVANMRKGFILACFGFLPSLLGFIGAWKITPIVTMKFRGTELFLKLTEKVNATFNIENIITDTSMRTQTDIIKSMNVPDFMKNMMIENNNPTVYNLFNTETLQGYITNILTNIVVSVCGAVLVFIIIFAVCKIVLSILNQFAELPILSFINGTGGFLVGIIKATIIIWVICLALTYVYYNPSLVKFVNLLENSKIALWFYSNNILLLAVVKLLGQ